MCASYLGEYLKMDMLAQESRTCYSLCTFELLSILKSAFSKVPTALIKVLQSEMICNIPDDGSGQRTTITPHFLRVLKLARVSQLSCCVYSVSSNEIKQPVSESYPVKEEGNVMLFRV